ncbi:hypothetical protein H4S07_006888, partial [Coemansia furcata]
MSGGGGSARSRLWPCTRSRASSIARRTCHLVLLVPRCGCRGLKMLVVTRSIGEQKRLNPTI